jgi:uncharacterized protein (TIGR00661 family)
MARILYGVHGTGHGHAIRALTIARHFPEHEFLFITHADGVAILEPEFPVAECPGFETTYRSHRVAMIPTITRNARIWWQRQALMRPVLELLERFRPDVCLCDYEYFLPRACKHMGLPCLSVDHQHIITCCSHRVPLSQFPSYLGTSLAVRFLFSEASFYLITSFFQAPVKRNSRAQVLPPLLRESVLARQPEDGDHVLAYQGYRPPEGFFPFLKTLPRPVVVYGLNIEREEGNLCFKKNSEQGFLQDLASCGYVVCGGGYSLISEALFYGKPVMAFPMKNAFEQFLNGHYLEILDYGRFFTELPPRLEITSGFEAHLERFRLNIRKGRFCGNSEIFALIDQFIRQKTLSPVLG